MEYNKEYHRTRIKIFATQPLLFYSIDEMEITLFQEKAWQFFYVFTKTLSFVSQKYLYIKKAILH